MSLANEDLLKGEQFSNAITRVVDWAKRYVADYVADHPAPVDPSAEAVKHALDQLNGEVIGNTSWEKVSAALHVKEIMQSQFSSLGFTQTGLFSHYPSFINKLAQPTGVFIEDTNGDLWTAEDWTNYHTSETPLACVVITSSLAFRIGFTQYSMVNQGKMVQWYGAPIYATANDAFSESRTGLDLTRALLASICPAILGQDKSGANYSKDRLIANLPTTGHYYDSLAEFQEETSGNTSDVYIVNYAGTTDGSNMHVYYWSGVAFVDTGAKETSLAANVASRAVWQYKAHTDDTIQWHEPLLAWIRAMYQNIAAVDACFVAVTGSAINRLNVVWSTQQSDARRCFYFNIREGTTGLEAKASNSSIFPFAAYE